MSIEDLIDAVDNSNMETEAKAEIRELIKAGHNARIEEKVQQGIGASK
jgi:hypothetical protein